VGTRTSGSGGGGEQTTARERGTAARLRPYLEIVRRTQRNVKRWSSGEMALRWTAAGMLEAERQFRKIIGCRDLATLVVAIEREHDARGHSVDAAPTSTKEAAIVAAM
jgi:putative transposase